VSDPSGATRVVVVGADAAGMSAAHQALRTARRTGRDLAITVLDKGAHTSYSACGIPYWMAGDVDSGDELVARTADAHRESGIDLRLGAEVIGADLTARTVTLADGEEVVWDELVVATGAPAVVPDWALRPDWTTYDGVGTVKTLDDGAAWLERFAGAGDGAHVVVVGAGYVMLKVAEAAMRHGFGVTVLTRGRGMSMLEDEMADRVDLALCEAGAEVVLGAEVTGLDTEDGRVTGVRVGSANRAAARARVSIVGLRIRRAGVRGPGSRPASFRSRRRGWPARGRRPGPEAPAVGARRVTPARLRGRAGRQGGPPAGWIAPRQGGSSAPRVCGSSPPVATAASQVGPSRSSSRTSSPEAVPASSPSGPTRDNRVTPEPVAVARTTTRAPAAR